MPSNVSLVTYCQTLCPTMPSSVSLVTYSQTLSPTAKPSSVSLVTYSQTGYTQPDCVPQQCPLVFSWLHTARLVTYSQTVSHSNALLCFLGYIQPDCVPQQCCLVFPWLHIARLYPKVTSSTGYIHPDSLYQSNTFPGYIPPGCVPE